MKSISEIKAQGKLGLQSKHWMCVGALVIYSLILSASGFTGIVAVVLAGPLLCGLNAFSLQVQLGLHADLGTMFSEGFVNFGRKVGAFWYQQLFIFLWSLLLVIPGIVKAFAYSQQMFILADCPDVTYDESLALSQRMMQGHKWELFCLHLSFLGWHILGGLTFGILEVLYVAPYLQQTLAQYYLDLKMECVRSGEILENEFYPNR